MLRNPLNRALDVTFEEMKGQLVSIYEYLHRHPELSMEEHRTAAIAAAWLSRHGHTVTTAVDVTGVVGVPITTARSATAGRPKAF